MTVNVGNKNHLKQSKVRVHSTLKLIAFLAIAIVIAYYFAITWLWKILGTIAAFFLFTLLIELINVLRLKNKMSDGG